MEELNGAVRRALLRKSAVLAATGNSNSGLYADIAAGLMVAGVKVAGRRAAAWPSDEVETIVSARIGGASTEQIKALVQRLHERRKAAVQQLLAEAAL